MVGNESFSEFREKCTQDYLGFITRDQDEVQDPIYHYTNYIGLKGILKSRTLYMTDYRKLKDPSEIKYAI